MAIERINCTTNELTTFMDNFTAPTHEAECSLIAKVISNVTRAIFSFFGPKISIATIDGSRRFAKHDILQALSQSNEAIVLLEKQYQIAQKLQQIAHMSIFTKRFSKHTIFLPQQSPRIRRQLPTSEQPLPHTTKSTKEPLQPGSYFVASQEKNTTLSLIEAFSSEVRELLKEAPASRGFHQKLPEWCFLLENILASEVHDFFITNGENLLPTDLDAKIDRINKYRKVLEQVSADLHNRYSSLSPLSLLTTSRKARTSLRETIINFDCFIERMSVFESCLLFSQRGVKASLKVPNAAPREFQGPLVNPGEIRVLTAMGGGIKGALSSQLLKKIEERINQDLPLAQRRPIGDYVDILSGTSTGAIIAALASVGYSASAIDSLYQELGDRVFKGQENRITNFLLEIKRMLWRPKYERGTRFSKHRIGRAYLEEKSRQLLDMPFSATTTELAIPFCIFDEHKKERTKLITSRDQKELPIGQQYMLGDVILASTSANSFFPHTNLIPIEMMVLNQNYMRLRMYPDSVPPHLMNLLRDPSVIPAVDGGFTSNDPSCKVVDTYELIEQHKRISLLTLGTGKNPAASQNPYSSDIPTVKQIQTLCKAPMAAIERDTKSRLKSLQKRGRLREYIMLNPHFSKKVQLDSIRRSAKRTMQQAATNFIQEDRKGKFSRAVDMLRPARRREAIVAA